MKKNIYFGGKNPINKIRKQGCTSRGIHEQMRYIYFALNVAHCLTVCLCIWYGWDGCSGMCEYII